MRDGTALIYTDQLVSSQTVSNSNGNTTAAATAATARATTVTADLAQEINPALR